MNACREKNIPVWADIEATWRKENAGKTVLGADELAYAQALARAAAQKILTAETADGVSLAALLELGDPEVSIFSEYEGSELKVRPDRLIELQTGFIIVSWKTCREGKASPRAYARTYRYEHYDLADAMYIDVIEKATGKPVIAVVNVVIEKLGESSLDASAPAPEAVAIYETYSEDEVIERGRDKYRSALEEAIRFRRSQAEAETLLEASETADGKEAAPVVLTAPGYSSTAQFIATY